MPKKGDQKKLKNPLRRPSESELEVLDSYRGFILSNSPLFAALGIITLCLALLMYGLKAPIYAPWLAGAILAFASAGLLLVGDKARLMSEQVTWVGAHYVEVSAILFLVGWYVETATAPRVARFFYWTATLLFVVAAVAIAVFGTHEWFHERLSVQNSTLNFWLMTYSVLFFFCGFLSERFGKEGQRNLAWVYYYLCPMFLFHPLNVLMGQGWQLVTLGDNPLDIYEVLHLVACVGFLAMGRLLHTKIFVLVGLWGIVFLVFRATFRHFLQDLGWPLTVGILGGALVLVGVFLPLWMQRRRERGGMRRTPAPAAPTEGPGPHEAETLPIRAS